MTQIFRSTDRQAVRRWIAVESNVRGRDVATLGFVPTAIATAASTAFVSLP